MRCQSRDPSATFGGMIATNAGGSRALGYGVTKESVRGLEFVLPDGKIMDFCRTTMKSSSGYNPPLVGSEGTLGVITKAVVKLEPIPQATATLIVPYENLHDAIATVPKIITRGTRPVALEFVQQDVIEMAERIRGMKSVFSGGQAYLMVEFNSSDMAEVYGWAQQVDELCRNNGSKEARLAYNHETQQQAWDFRGRLYEAIKPYTIEILDIVVPRAEIANHEDAVQAIGRKYNVWIPNYGHAGDGNVHSHLMKVRHENGRLIPLEQDELERIIPIVRDEIHQDAIKRGGLVSGEHGIGVIKMKYLPLCWGSNEIELMKKTKKMYDPNNILNPGKIFDISKR